MRTIGLLTLVMIYGILIFSVGLKNKKIYNDLYFPILMRVFIDVRGENPVIRFIVFVFILS